MNIEYFKKYAPDENEYDNTQLSDDQFVDEFKKELQTVIDDTNNTTIEATTEKYLETIKENITSKINELNEQYISFKFTATYNIQPYNINSNNNNNQLDGVNIFDINNNQITSLKFEKNIDGKILRIDKANKFNPNPNAKELLQKYGYGYGGTNKKTKKTKSKRKTKRSKKSKRTKRKNTRKYRMK